MSLRSLFELQRVLLRPQSLFEPQSSLEPAELFEPQRVLLSPQSLFEPAELRLSYFIEVVNHAVDTSILQLVDFEIDEVTEMAVGETHVSEELLEEYRLKFLT